MVMTACNISAGESPPPSPGPPARPLFLPRFGVLKNKRTYEGGCTSLCSTGSTTSQSEGKMEKYLLKPWGLRPKQRWVLPLFGAIYRYSGDSITTEATKSTRVPESMASRPADILNGA